MPSGKQVLAFDIYGTLLNTNAIGIALQSLLGINEEQANALSLLWRRYQLEYTWRLNSMGVYEPFDILTSDALQHAMSEHGYKYDERLVVALMAAYNRLKEFDDAVPAMTELAKVPNVDVVVFSNGTEEMVTMALQVGSLSTLSKRIFVADQVRTYKPSRAIYEGLLQYLNRDAPEPIPAENVWLVSGNPFDVVGARNAGMQAIWVDRAGTGWIDRAAAHTPSRVVRSLGEIVEVVKHLDA